MAPVVARYLPAAQSVQPALPLVALYLPAAQAVHDTPSGPVYPALHLQAVERLLPIGESEFTGQAVHAPEPEAALYLAASQSTHVAPSEPLAPGLHLQSVRNADAADELELAGQSWQVGLPISDHVPGAHALHVSLLVAPKAVEYKPPAHFEHSYRFVMLS